MRLHSPDPFSLFALGGAGPRDYRRVTGVFIDRSPLFTVYYLITAPKQII